MGLFNVVDGATPLLSAYSQKPKARLNTVHTQTTLEHVDLFVDTLSSRLAINALKVTDNLALILQ